MRRHLAIWLSLAFCWANDSQADQSSRSLVDVERAFGNTIVSTYPDGRTGLLWLAPDGAYAASGRKRTRSSGRWMIKGAQICLKQSKPWKAPFTYCTELPSAEAWEARAPTGERITVKLLAGIVETP